MSIEVHLINGAVITHLGVQNAYYLQDNTVYKVIMSDREFLYSVRNILYVESIYKRA